MIPQQNPGIVPGFCLRNMKFILGRKLEMTQIFKEKERKVVPITLITAGPCFITQVKTKDKDSYEALQVGFEKKERKIKKSEKGKEFKHLKEFRGEFGEMKVGDKIDVSVFEVGDKVKVTGISKGKGFQGAVKRWGFHGRNATHGVKHEQRTLGSVGASGPERVFKGKKMPGRMGADRVTVKNLEVAKVDTKNNLIALKGAIPGRRGTLVEIRG